MAKQFHNFECQLYIPAHGPMTFRMPAEAGPRRLARLAPLGYDELLEPSFRRLLAAFESLPQPLPIVQV